MNDARRYDMYWDVTDIDDLNESERWAEINNSVFSFDTYTLARVTDDEGNGYEFYHFWLTQEQLESLPPQLKRGLSTAPQNVKNQNGGPRHTFGSFALEDDGDDGIFTWPNGKTSSFKIKNTAPVQNGKKNGHNL